MRGEVGLSTTPMSVMKIRSMREYLKYEGNRSKDVLEVYPVMGVEEHLTITQRQATPCRIQSKLTTDLQRHASKIQGSYFYQK
jgi:hypothetical protein